MNQQNIRHYYPARNKTNIKENFNELEQREQVDIWLLTALLHLRLSSPDDFIEINFISMLLAKLLIPQHI